MLLYGICVNEITNIKTEGLKSLLKIVDVYDTCMDDCRNEDGSVDDDEILGWVDNYEENGGYGLGALLYAAIEKSENCDISVDIPSDGLTYLGLQIDLPWKYKDSTRNMTEEEYNAILAKYVNMVTDEEIAIRTWNITDDADW